MHTTTTTTPPSLPGGKRPGWAQRHPFWAAFLGGFAAVAVLAGAFSFWLAASGQLARPAAAAHPAATAPAAHKAHHHKPRTKIIVVPAPQAAAPPQAPVQTGTYGPYLDDLARAGIVAPDDWAVQAANNLEAAWGRGETEKQTDREYLIPGGIFPNHLAAFNAIVHANFG